MKLRLIGLMLVAAFALTAATTASATSFKASKTGTVTLKGEGNQELTTPSGKVVCTGLSGATPISQTEMSSLTVLVTYSKCEGFGTTVTVTTGEILFDANGSITLPNTDKFVITSAVGKCSVLVQSSSETTTVLFGTVKYTNNANGSITGNGNVTGLSAVAFSSAKHTICGTAKEAVASSYVGVGVSSIAGGTLKVE
jgi:hypothetical protein